MAGTDRLLADEGPDTVARATHAVVTRLEECLGDGGRHAAVHRPGQRRRGLLPGLRRPALERGRRGAHAAGPQALRRLGPAAGRAGGLQPRPRLRRGARRPTRAAFSAMGDTTNTARASCPRPPRGHVFVAELGAPTRAAFSAMGDTTNTAARIMSKAAPGLLYAHPVVLEHSRTLFATEPAGPFEMKGKAVPLLVYSVGEESGTREQRRSCARCAGDRAFGGEGAVVTVTGTTGMGKTRLVREAAAVARGRRAADGARRALRRGQLLPRLPRPAAPAARHRAGHARRTMGRQLLESLAASAPDLLPMSPLIADVAHVEVPSTPEADALDPQFRPDRLADVLVDLVGRMVPGPILLIAEEAHWADVASAHLLERIAGATRGRPWAWSPSAAAWRAASSRRQAHDHARPAASRRHGATRHRGDRGRSAAAARGAGDRRAGRGQPALRRGDHARRPHRWHPGHDAGLAPGRDGRADRPARADRAPHPPHGGRARPQLPPRGPARDPQRRRPDARPRPAHPAVRLPRCRRAGPAPLPQQPGARRRLRGARLQDARKAASCCRTRHGAAQRGPRLGRPDALAALLPRRRRRAHVDLRADGRGVGTACLRECRRRGAVRAGPRRGEGPRRADVGADRGVDAPGRAAGTGRDALRVDCGLPRSSITGRGGPGAAGRPPRAPRTRPRPCRARTAPRCASSREVAACWRESTGPTPGVPQFASTTSRP